jgi:hypothetical protein
MIYLIAILIYLFTLTGIGIYKARQVRTKADFSFAITVDTRLHYAGGVDWDRLHRRQRRKAEQKCAAYINYDAVEKYRNFGGIRIEDDVLVTDNGYRILCKKIPKSIDDVQTLCSSG